MKTLLICTLSLLATVANAQDTMSVIFNNGSSSFANGTYAGYGFVGGLIQTPPPPFGPVMSTGSAEESPSSPTASLVYPNPSNGTFAINVPELGSHYTASLYDECGGFVLDATPCMTCADAKINFRLNNVSSGDYFLLVTDEKHRRMYSLIVNR